MEGNILKISRFCTDDGPGIRTTVFLKGCPLSCKWCHNPETQNCKAELFYDKNKCINCARCVNVCVKNNHSIVGGSHFFDRTKCDSCGKCAINCPAKALELIGVRMSDDDIVDELKKDVVFYQTSGGGITISGGEPLFQPDFTESILRKCREENIHTAIETSGFAKKEDFIKAIKYCDLILFDVKDTNFKRHIENVGVPFDLIWSNLKILGESKKPFIIRAPIIPSINDNVEHILALKEISKRWESCQGVEIMPYHSLGNYKYLLLNKPYYCESVEEPSKDKINEWNKLLKS